MARAKENTETEAELKDRRALIDKAMADLNNVEDEEAAEILERADTLLKAREDRFAELRAQRDAIDAEYGIRARQRQEQKERQREDAYQQKCQSLLEGEESKLADIQAAEEHFAAGLDLFARAFATAERQRPIARELADMLNVVKIPAQYVEMQGYTNRLMDRLAALISAKNKNRKQFSSMTLKDANLYHRNPTGWMEQEEKIAAKALQYFMEIEGQKQ